MKILQLTAHFSPNVGGVETHLDDLVLALTKRKREVFVLTYRPITTKSKWKVWESKKNLKILRIPWISGFFYRLVDNPILEFIYLTPGLFFITPIVVFFYNPKVLHSHGLIAGFAAVFWGRIFSKSVITTTHSIYHFPERGLYKSFSKWIFSKSDRVLTLSKQSKREVTKLGIEKKKVKVFTYWIDTDIFKPVQSAKGKLKWKTFTVLFVGRLIEVKGINTLLGAFNDWNKNITLAIVGTGPLEEKVKELSQDRKTLRVTNKSQASSLLYLGKIANYDMPKYYSAADLVIVPSTHEEGFGRVILESLACGTPVIGSKRGAIPEAMDKSVGKLIKVTRANIVKTVEYFYNNPDKLEKLSNEARKFALKRYSEQNVEQIIKTYK